MSVEQLAGFLNRPLEGAMIRGPSLRATMIAADLRPMSSAPLDGTPVRLFASLGSAIASFWTAERSRKAFGAGNYRAGWFLLDDEAVELNNPMGWEPLTHEIDR